MKKVYCDRCGKEVEQEYYITLHKKAVGTNVVSAGDEFFDICPKCRESFFGWLNLAPVAQEKPVKLENAKAQAKPSKNEAKPYTLAEVVAKTPNTPESSVRRHLQKCLSTYTRDKHGHVTRHYHLTDKQLTDVLKEIENRGRGKKIK